MGIHVLLGALGIGVSLSALDPITDANPVAQLSVVSVILWAVGALIALMSGGFIAGRFAQSSNSGAVHGLIVWSLTLLFTLSMFSLGTGMALGGALKVLGSGLGMAANVVAASAGDVATEGVQRAADQLNSFIDEGVQSAPAGATPQATTRAKREIGFAVAQLFAPGNDVASQALRRAVTRALVENTAMTEAEAVRRVNDWTTSYTQLTAESKRLAAFTAQHAKDVADLAAKRLSTASLWTFVALLIGLMATSFGGMVGAKTSLRDYEGFPVGVH